MLMRLSVHGVTIPSGIHKLKALQTLDAVNIARREATLDDIKRLAQLRKLGVSGINKTNLGKLPEWIMGLKNLLKLKLWGSRILEHDSDMRSKAW